MGGRYLPFTPIPLAAYYDWPFDAAKPKRRMVVMFDEMAASDSRTVKAIFRSEDLLGVNIPTLPKPYPRIKHWEE
jgi:hypothetical protein